jgi:TonB family protein
VAVHLLVLIGWFGAQRRSPVQVDRSERAPIDIRFPSVGSSGGGTASPGEPGAPDLPSGPVFVPLVASVPEAAGWASPGIDPRDLVPGCDSLCVRGVAGPAQAVVIAGSELATPPRLIAAPEPRYPEALRQAVVRGSVSLEFVVDVAGRVEPGSVQVHSATDPAFSAAAVESALGERFTPGRMGGVAVRTRVRQLITFNVS